MAVPSYTLIGAKVELGEVSDYWKAYHKISAAAASYFPTDEFKGFCFFAHLAVNRDYKGQGIFIKMVMALGEYLRKTINIKGLCTFVTAP